MNNNQNEVHVNVQKAGKTGLFTNYIFKAIPLAFDESLSYYECLCGLLNYLKNTVIPVLNNNADAIVTLQNNINEFETNINQEMANFKQTTNESIAIFEQSVNQTVQELQNYVNNYFANLDVQDEINNKLDQMVISGVLPEIIDAYLSIKSLLAFDTVASMKISTNLINGSYARTLGYYSVNDGGGALYKIRTKTLADTEENGKIIFIGLNLVADLIYDKNINVLSIGLKNDGETDNNEKLYKFINAYEYNEINLKFPKGTYLFNKEDHYITLPNYTKLIGEDNTKIYFNDTTDDGLSLFNGSINSLDLDNIEFISTYDTVTSQTNSANLYYNQSEIYNDVIINKCKFKNFRRNIFDNLNTNSLTLTNSEYYNVGRDSNRFLNCRYSFVNGNKFNLCGDDVVSCHGDEDSSTHIFANNYVELSLGPAYLGGKYIDIHDNTFINPILLFKTGVSGDEGGTTERIDFHNNSVIQPIKLDGISGDKLMWLGNGTKNIYINNNEFKDGTLETVDVINFVGTKYTNQAVSKGHFIISTNDSSYTHEYVQFNNNYCDIKTGPASLDLGDTRFMLGKFKNLDMYNNVIENFYNTFIAQANIKLNWNIKNNYFNGDKEHLLSTDGMFTNSNSLRIFSIYPANFENNTIRNISGNYGMTKPNKILYQPDGKYMNPISNESPSIFLPYNETTGEILNDPLVKSSTMPTSGYYHEGDYVSSNYVNANTPIGWYRLTTGNTHVLDTDWVAVYPKLSA